MIVLSNITINIDFQEHDDMPRCMEHFTWNYYYMIFSNISTVN